MKLHEPISAITDLILSLMCFAFTGILGWLWWNSLAIATNLHFALWASFFFSAGIGTAIGTFDHGIHLPYERDMQVAKWMIGVGGVSLYPFMLEVLYIYGGIIMLERYWLWMLLPLAIYIVVLFFRYHFLIFIVYSGALLVLATVLLGTCFARGEPVGLMLLAIAVMIVGSIVQATKRTLPPFNHNDLYHLFEMVVISLFFANALQLKPY